MIAVRTITEIDYPMILSWWPEGEIKPVRSQMPSNSTFVTTVDGIPVGSVSVWLTNTPNTAFVECFIGNPSLKGPVRYAATQALAKHIEKYAKKMGYSALVGFTDNPKLKDRYLAMGYTPSLPNITMYTKELN